MALTRKYLGLLVLAWCYRSKKNTRSGAQGCAPHGLITFGIGARQSPYRSLGDAWNGFGMGWNKKLHFGSPGR
jgi:hypothetical protein